MKIGFFHAHKYAIYQKYRVMVRILGIWIQNQSGYRPHTDLYELGGGFLIHFRTTLSTWMFANIIRFEDDKTYLEVAASECK